MAINKYLFKITETEKHRNKVVGYMISPRYYSKALIKHRLTDSIFFLHNLSLIYILFFASLIILSGCGRNHSPEEEKYINLIKSQRVLKDNEMRSDPSSPFNKDSKIHFENLKYFDVDPAFLFNSKLYEYNIKDTVKVFGTKGEQREYLRFGYIKFKYDNKEYKMNVYKGKTKSNIEYYSLWFTDKTTNNETYGVGRYIDFEINMNKDFIYTIDFNKAYNPYCAYSALFSCAVPLKEDYLDIRITAGEKKFHK
jgi:uncharacterized protein